MMKLTEQQITNATNILDNILNNETTILDPITASINERAKQKSYLRRFLLILADTTIPFINIFATVKKTNIFDDLLYQYVTKDTNFHIYQYESFMPNACTIPGNLFHEAPRLSVLSSMLPITQILIILNYILKNANKYTDLKPNLETKPVNLNTKDITIFFSDSLSSRVELNDKELLAIIFHELGHNMIRKTHINYSLIAIVIIIIERLWKQFRPDAISALPLTILTSATVSQQLLFILLISFAIMIIFRFFRRSLEYGSDEFAARMGLPKETKSALQKLYKVLVKGAKTDNTIEKIINFIPRHMYALINFIAKFGLLDYPSFEQRIQHIDDLKLESTILLEGTVENIYQKVVEKLTNTLLLIHKTDPIFQK